MTDAAPLELSLVPIEPLFAMRGAALTTRQELRAATLHGGSPRGWHFGPGWFDSSWELRAGLEVREGSEEESLFAWIEGWLQPGGGSAVSLSAT